MFVFELPKSIRENPKAELYVVELFHVLAHKIGNQLVSMILFGSFINGRVSKSSDLDLVIVVDDDCDRELLKKIDILAESLEIKNGFSEPCIGFNRMFFRALERGTGMFVSRFICRRRDFLKGDFSRIFGVNRVLSRILAPSEIVLATFQRSAKTIFGEHLLTTMRRPNIGPFQIAKSLFMNLFLSLGSLMISPFNRRSMRFAMEAVKWSLHSCTYYLTGRNNSVENGAKYFIDHGVCREHIKRMLSLRKRDESNLRFVISSPLATLKIHLATLKTRFE